MPAETYPENKPQIKVCGLTHIEEAVACTELGVNAIGCNFYPKSPRYVTDDQAKTICDSLPSTVKAVGIFVNDTFSDIMHKVEYCRLDAVQLHGQESPKLVNRLLNEDLLIIKALFMEREPSLEKVSDFQASGYLVECGKGILPGGNAMEWNWEKARSFGEDHPLILAGGLTPENVSDAIEAGLPDAVDVSSGVESTPGQKDINKVASFVEAVSRFDYTNALLKKKIRPIF